jgi:hypothetical protein
LVLAVLVAPITEMDQMELILFFLPLHLLAVVVAA